MATKPSAIGASRGVYTRWVEELCLTWLGVLLLAVAPAVLFGSGVFSAGVLAVAVFIGFPSAVFGFATKRSASRGFRRLAVMLVVPLLTLAYVSEVDQQIPQNSTPLTQAIESFKRETGDYPDSLEALIPKHLAELPEVRFSVFQPEITYRIRDGKSHLAIPSAMGDMFAQFEYNFETKKWQHQS